MSIAVGEGMYIQNAARILAVVLVAASANGQTPIKVFVDQSAPTAMGTNGQGWSTAYLNLQPAIDDVMANFGGGRILVAEGTYRPEDPFDPNVSGGTHSQKTYLIDGTLLQLSTNILGIHGGFLGYDVMGGTSENYKVPDGSFENTLLTATSSTAQDAGGYHVITVTGMLGKLEIDGFRITRGFAQGAASAFDDVGGGLRILKSGSIPEVGVGTILVENCEFELNYANAEGGAVWMEGFALRGGPLTIKNTDFLKNSANEGGAIFQNQSTVVWASNVLFKKNGKLSVPANKGGAIRVDFNSTFLAQNCVFHDNKAFSGGGAGYLTSRCTDGGQDMKDFNHCTIAFNKSTNGTGGLLYDCKPNAQNPVPPPFEHRIDNTILWNNTTTSTSSNTDVLVIPGGSPPVNFTVFADYSSFSSTSSTTGVAPAALGVRLFGDPIFFNPATRNLRLRALASPSGGTFSPCLDMGQELNGFLDTDRADLDGNMDYDDDLPLDKDLGTRVINYTGVPGGIPGGRKLDIGAYETADSPPGGGL